MPHVAILLIGIYISSSMLDITMSYKVYGIYFIKIILASLSTSSNSVKPTFIICLNLIP